MNDNVDSVVQPWCPDRDPITLRPFFMWIEHPERGMVPTYGGPFDSYTLADRDASVQRIPHPPQIPPRRIPMRIPPPAAQRNRVSNPPPEVPAQRNRAHLPAGLRVEPVGKRPSACGPVLASGLNALQPVGLRDGDRPHLKDADGAAAITDGRWVAARLDNAQG